MTNADDEAILPHLDPGVNQDDRPRPSAGQVQLIQLDHQEQLHLANMTS
jgi:hypothetical protein